MSFRTSCGIPLVLHLCLFYWCHLAFLQISWHLWALRAPSTLTGSIWRWTANEPRSIKFCPSLWSTRWSYEWQSEWGGWAKWLFGPGYWHTHTTCPQNNAQSHTHAHYSQLLRATDPGSCGVYSAFGYEKGWCESMWKVEAPLTELALPVMNCQVITPSLAAMLAVSSWRQKLRTANGVYANVSRNY